MFVPRMTMCLLCLLTACAAAQTASEPVVVARENTLEERATVSQAVLPAGPLGAGDYPADRGSLSYLTLRDVPGQGGRVREYKLHVPASYDARKPAPVLFAFHGWHQNASAFAIQGAAWVDKSDEAGFLLVMPNGVQADGVGGSFNAGTCCGAATEEHIDDVAFVRALLAEVAAHWTIDAQRVYAAGLSNGAFFSHRLACEASDVIVAIVALAGAIGTNEHAPNPRARAPTDFAACKPARPVAVLAIHGTKDKLVPYAAMLPTLAAWAKHDGCSDRAVPATEPASAADATCISYPDCKDGVAVTGCTIEGGGHCWFGSPNCGLGAMVGMSLLGPNSKTFEATNVAWSFLQRFARAP